MITMRGFIPSLDGPLELWSVVLRLHSEFLSFILDLSGNFRGEEGRMKAYRGCK